MEKDKREALKKNSQIVVAPYFNSGNNVTFYIEKEIGRGSSAICYEAYYKEGDVPVWGTLKEFYPYDFDPSPAFDVIRNDAVDDIHKNQLFSNKGTLQNFLSYKNSYVNPYDVLRRLRAEKREYPREIDRLNKFLPNPELFRGLGHSGYDSDNTSVYIWVKNEPNFKSYKDILRDICMRMRENGYNSIYDVSLILNCIYRLAVCVDTLHLFSIYHLDLKPENFGISVLKGENADIADRISLYDVNSLYSGRDRDSIVLSSGTEYFRSPEVAKGNLYKFGPMSDVYSLGAILYYSLIYIENKDDFGNTVYENVRFCEGKGEFDETEYNNIGVRLRNSLILDNSDETAKSIIFRKLYHLLLKSLNTDKYDNGYGFYETAEEFANDLSDIIEELKISAGKAAVDRTSEYFVKTELNKKEEYIASKNKNGAKGVIQWLLFKYPLYDYCIKRESAEDGCNVLVLGGATYASKFIDLAFELSQVKDCGLDITVACRDFEDDKATYLATRPGMPDFFEIDGNAPKAVAEPYGKLSFAEAKFEIGTENELTKAVSELLSGKEYTYIFIALGDDAINGTVAKSCAKYLRKKGKQKSLISYTVFNEKEETGCDNSLQKKDDNFTVIKLSVYDSLEKHSEYKMLRQMAFNAHMIWFPDFINDINSAKAKFRGKYNFDSSLDNVLSIKYKLHSIKPDLKLDFSNPNELAAEVAKIVGIPGTKTAGNKPKVRELTMYEHRRWIVEKVTDSWQTLTDITSLHSTTKDDANRRHPCIVESGNEFSLSQPKWNNAHKALWNNAEEADKEGLDALDRLSVDMHQHFLREAENLKIDNIELNSNCERIRTIAIKNSFAYCAYEGLKDSIDVLTGGTNEIPENVNKFRYYKKMLRGCLFSENDKKIVISSLNKLEKIIFPAIQAASYKNWKTVDESLIRRIPFILTYHTALHLCVPFFMETKGAQDTTSLFGNVAASLMLNPLYITYIVDGDIALKNFDSLIASLSYCVRTIKNHRLQTRINVQVFRNSKDCFTFEAQQRILNISEIIHSVDDIPYEGWNQVEKLYEFLIQKSVSFTAIELNSTRISGVLQSANSLKNNTDQVQNASGDGVFPMYMFNSLERKFNATDGCKFFIYVGNNPGLLVDDLFFGREKTFEFSEPELIDEYKDLWNIYAGKNSNERKTCTAAWKNLCGAIKAHMEKTNRIAKFSVYEKDTEVLADYSVCFPAFCRDSLELILSNLQNHKMNEAEAKKLFEKYYFEKNASNSVKLKLIKVRKYVAEEIEKMLSQPLRLAEKNLLGFSFPPEGMTVFSYPLRIENLILPTNGTAEVLNTLSQLRDKKCIRSYSQSADNKSVAFTFATEQHMRLLVNEGNILEMYVYREAVESQLFDDVKTGVTVFWDNDGMSNEMDVILIKGFQTMIVECKAVKDLKPEFYDKLYPLCKTFGVNNIPVILADLDGKISVNTSRQKSRGEELGIETIITADKSAENLNNLFPVH